MDNGFCAFLAAFTIGWDDGDKQVLWRLVDVLLEDGWSADRITLGLALGRKYQKDSYLGELKRGGDR